jgi:hypothetical protein
MFAFWTCCLAVDLPLSAVADTLTLPWTIQAELVQTSDVAPAREPGDQPVDTRAESAISLGRPISNTTLDLAAPPFGGSPQTPKTP